MSALREPTRDRYVAHQRPDWLRPRKVVRAYRGADRRRGFVQDPMDSIWVLTALIVEKPVV